MKGAGRCFARTSKKCRLFCLHSSIRPPIFNAPEQHSGRERRTSGARQTVVRCATTGVRNTMCTQGAHTAKRVCLHRTTLFRVSWRSHGTVCIVHTIQLGTLGCEGLHDLRKMPPSSRLSCPPIFDFSYFINLLIDRVSVHIRAAIEIYGLVTVGHPNTVFLGVPFWV